MRIDILTLFPEQVHPFISTSIIKKAIDKNVVEIIIHNIRDYSKDKHKKVDDYAFGGAAGMVIKVEPLHLCIEELLKSYSYDEIIYMTPDGDSYNQKYANSLSLKNNLMIICGHYKGIDQRIRDNYVTKEISIGDYVLTGGELAASVVIDSIVRLIPGAISDITSALTDSFQDNLLAPPVYTRPEVYNGWTVPDILLSGNTAQIDAWHLEQSLEKTKLRRPDLLDSI
ncbi:MAG: tRNA (guanosine(37)-N1)-methyltransferase TrmD [Bacteroidales bacterium]|nr:tRNA (guanosine(37)-N1)-methyltransferase TrmD [Bacteroidales bacterium]